MACSHRRQDSFVLSRPSFDEFCFVSTLDPVSNLQLGLMAVACSHRLRGQDKTVLSRPRWRCEQAIFQIVGIISESKSE